MVGGLRGRYKGKNGAGEDGVSVALGEGWRC